LVPYAKNKSFVERFDVFERLKSEFCHGPGDDIEDARFRVCLFGLGGIGKTQIAIAYTYWLRKAHPEISVFWVHASNSKRFRQALSEIANECRIPGCSDPNVDVLAVVKSWFQRQSTVPWFLVLDNCDDSELFFNDSPRANDTRLCDLRLDSENGNLARFIPDYGNGSILVTTRNKQAGSRLVPGQPSLKVGPMNHEEAVQMFRKISGDSLLSTEAAFALSNRLENLPLAIAQAAAFMQKNCMSIHQYLGILNRGDNNVEVQLLSENFGAFTRDTDVPRAVMATWTVSFEHIKKRNSLAAEILSLMAFSDRLVIQRQFMT
ncbi:P-loop containing nucleoside triphosphate hydrolase protein, partial [Colletotrichum godetiae]